VVKVTVKSNMPTTTARTEFLAGVRAELPILLGVAPFGMIYGALAIGAGLPRGAAQAMSAIVFAGSAQFVATQLFATGAPGLVLLLTTFIVNLRHMLYSASLAPYLHKLPARWKWLLAYLLTDEAYAPTILHYQQAEVNHGDTESTEMEDSLRPPRFRGEISDDASSDKRHWFFLGAGLALWSVWQVSTAVGIFLGAQVPPSWALDFTLALTFIALLVPVLTDRPSVAAALSAGIIALVGAGWPYKLGLVTAALVGIAVGAWLDRRRSQSREQEQISFSAGKEA
jgi:predicted branched-subunit amino acid permease